MEYITHTRAVIGASRTLSPQFGALLIAFRCTSSINKHTKRARDHHISLEVSNPLHICEWKYFDKQLALTEHSAVITSWLCAQALSDEITQPHNRSAQSLLSFRMHFHANIYTINVINQIYTVLI